MVTYFSNSLNRNEVQKLYPSKTKIISFVRELITKKFFDDIDKTIQEEVKRYGNHIESELKASLKPEMFQDSLEDYSYVMGARLYEDMKHGGDYEYVLKDKNTEEKVLAYDCFYDVRLLQVGRVDKVYRLTPTNLFIRDDKLTSSWNEKTISEWSLQIGGYAHCYHQLYNEEVKISGLVWLLRYFDILPLFPNESGYIEIVKNLCKFISEGKAK